MRQKRDERGSVFIEFALTFLLLVVIVSGTFEFGYAFFAYNTLINAVREGSRYASLRPYDSATSTPTTAFDAAVKNFVVYGNPAGGSTPILRGLSTSHVQLSVVAQGGVPGQVTVPWILMSPRWPAEVGLPGKAQHNQNHPNNSEGIEHV